MAGDFHDNNKNIGKGVKAYEKQAKVAVGAQTGEVAAKAPDTGVLDPKKKEEVAIVDKKTVVKESKPEKSLDAEKPKEVASEIA